MPRNDGRYDDLLSRAEAERLLTRTALRYPAFRLVKAGEHIPVGDYTQALSWRPRPFTGTIDVRRVAAHFARGATIVLQALHLMHEPLAVFARMLEAELGHPVQANAYYTPRAAQGLPVHHDTHDVFVLQIAGEKRWLVYAPALELPLRSQRYRPELGGPGDTLLDVVLRPGDTLYLPRGWLHEALTSDADSLHLTVGVNVHTWLDALKAALEECADDVRFRRSAEGEADDLLDVLASRLQRYDVERRRGGRLAHTRRPVLGDAFEQLRMLEQLTIDTPLERRSTVIADLSTRDGAVTLEFEGVQLTFPVRVREEVEFVARSGERFCPRDLPGRLDDAGRLVLVRRLVREGFVRVPAA